MKIPTTRAQSNKMQNRINQCAEFEFHRFFIPSDVRFTVYISNNAIKFQEMMKYVKFILNYFSAEVLLLIFLLMTPMTE